MAIYRSRLETARPLQLTALDADAYVVPKKLHAYDLASLRELAGKPVWIQGGYQITYYPFSPASKHADDKHEAGLLGPIERIEIKDVIKNPTPAGSEWQGPPGTAFAFIPMSKHFWPYSTKLGEAMPFLWVP